jgi:hypothetical protein
VYVPGSPSQKLFRFQNKLINPFLLFFFKKIFLSITTLLETEKFDSSWRSSPVDGNTVRRKLLVEDIPSSGKLRQPENPTRELFLQKKLLGRFGRGPTDAVHEAATLDTVSNIFARH